MIDGILSIHKQVGITSYDVIRKLKKLLGKKEKIGHAGTLDPFASGLLIILFGKATKMMNVFHSYKRVYEVEAELGYETDTQDVTGEIINKSKRIDIPTKDEIQDIVDSNFLGEIMQIPPRYSAKKIDGRRAYDLAREGVSFKLEPQKININQFEVFYYKYPFLKCKINCSSGTYVRTLINDLGILLGTYATCTKLIRTSVGNYNISEAVASESIEMENRDNILRRVINI
ncbi:tRNA pseudouridine(55) synthase TruB [Candidatus Dojkabacteria bacterium]|uniref:tRNA pseudouridine synthase B n=1 Tax=Candidatus Dojkabacteria bacterium TaxID=2099670 RepID=A0A847VE78_9BACT|nr:tRNA pseudouridine(55) synthase TruB [Candidatus Dojkabacteria bacterium]